MAATSTLRRTLRFGAVMAVVLLGLALTAPLDAAAVRGRVVYLNDAPAAGVAVRLTTVRGVSPFSYSNRAGMYYLNAIAAGTYTLEVWQNRRLVNQQTIVVKEPSCDVPVTKLP